MIYQSYKNFYDIDENRFNYISSYIFNYLNLEKKQFSLFIVGKSKIRNLNKIYHHLDTYTDIISLEYKDPFYIGEIFISPDLVHKNSQRFNCTFFIELDRVFIHGLLHILGYNHINTLNNHEKMFIIQEDILKKLKWNI
jgi:probable rRNA maturation factor